MDKITMNHDSETTRFAPLTPLEKELNRHVDNLKYALPKLESESGYLHLKAELQLAEERLEDLRETNEPA